MSDLVELIRKAAGTDKFIPVKTMDVNVDKVDIDKRVCYVSSADGSKSVENLKVRLMPTISDGDLNIPQIDSTITIVLTDFTEPYIVDYSELDSKTVNIGNQGWDIRDDKQVFNDGKYGGIPRIINPDDENKSLLARLNDQEDKYNDLVDQFNTLRGDFNIFVSIFNGHTHPYIDTPIGAAVTSPTTTQGSDTSASNGESIDITTQSDIENPNITHGDKFND